MNPKLSLSFGYVFVCLSADESCRRVGDVGVVVLQLMYVYYVGTTLFPFLNTVNTIL
jgi:hypothetical protein